MLTVPDAARSTGRNPETIRRWIRSGRLRASRVGTQHVIEEADLAAAVGGEDTTPLPDWLATDRAGRPQLSWERIVRNQRASH